jgi:RimJ/RimL family protein N-acetyltransferase
VIDTNIEAVNIPMIETDRLRLRGHVLTDFAHTKALWSDAAVVTYVGGKPHTVEECWARFLRYRGHWSLLHFGYWVVEEKDTGDFVGEVGFGDFKRDLEPPLGNIPELGWVLAAAKHGRGYATEAAQAALFWGRNHFGPTEVVCLIHPGHRASLRVAAKCGFAQRQLTTYKGKPAVILTVAI